MKRTEVQVKKNVVLVAPVPGSTLPRISFLDLAAQYAPRGTTISMANGGTGLMDWSDGTRRLVHEFWFGED